MSEPSKFKTSDVVYLKGGGFKMTVGLVKLSDDGIVLCGCDWHDQNGIAHHRDYIEDQLLAAGELAREARALSNNSQSEPQWVPVTSSRLDAVMYEPNRRVLSVRFKNGAESSYQGVEPEIARGLIKAPSPGRFFADNIKGRYGALPPNG